MWTIKYDKDRNKIKKEKIDTLIGKNKIWVWWYCILCTVLQKWMLSQCLWFDVVSKLKQRKHKMGQWNVIKNRNHRYLMFWKQGISEWKKCNCILVTKMNPSVQGWHDNSTMPKIWPKQLYNAKVRRVMGKYGWAITALWYAK